MYTTTTYVLLIAIGSSFSREYNCCDDVMTCLLSCAISRKNNREKKNNANKINEKLDALKKNYSINCDIKSPK